MFISGGFKSCEFGSADSMILTDAFFGSADSKRLAGSRGWRSGLRTLVDFPASRDSRSNCGTPGLPKPELEAGGWSLDGGGSSSEVGESGRFAEGGHVLQPVESPPSKVESAKLGPSISALAAQRNSPQRFGAPRFTRASRKPTGDGEATPGEPDLGAEDVPAEPAETHALQFMYTSKWLRAVSRSAHFFRFTRGSIRKDWPVAGVRRAEDAAQSERLFRTRGNKAAPAARDKGAALISDAFAEAQPEEPQRVNLLSD